MQVSQGPPLHMSATAVVISAKKTNDTRASGLAWVRQPMLPPEGSRKELKNDKLAKALQGKEPPLLFTDAEFTSFEVKEKPLDVYCYVQCGDGGCFRPQAMDTDLALKAMRDIDQVCAELEGRKGLTEKVLGVRTVFVDRTVASKDLGRLRRSAKQSSNVEK